MKEIISGSDLRKVIIEATDMICGAVSSTLGPSGNNVIINKDDLAPYITNDGVTIAESISSNDPKINTVLEILKESSLKTNEVVGDGTTTTLVLLESILKEGFKKIDNGENAIKLRKELNKNMSDVINELLLLKRKPTKEDLKSVACISAEDDKLGSFITDVFLKMKSASSIKIEESMTDKTYYEIKKGYSLDIDNIPSIYFKDSKEISLTNPYVLILNGYLNNLEEISEAINEGLITNKDIVIFATDYEESLMEDIILYKLQAGKNIFLFKVPEYGLRRSKVLEDLSTLANTDIVNIGFEKDYISNLKKIDKIIIKPNEVVIVNNSNVKGYISKLKKELSSSYETYDKEFLNMRISKLDKGVATIYIGGNTKTEKKEMIMRSIDAVCALDIASYGVVPGEGISLLRISDKISNEIIKTALNKPFEKIMENSGEDYIVRKKDIISSNYEKVFNLETLKYDDIKNSKVIDPVLVLIEALKNSISIATMLLTTNYLVINESYKNYNNDNIL